MIAPEYVIVIVGQEDIDEYYLWMGINLLPLNQLAHILFLAEHLDPGHVLLESQHVF